MNPDEQIDPESLKAIDQGLAQIARGEDRDFEEFAAEFRERCRAERAPEGPDKPRAEGAADAPDSAA